MKITLPLLVAIALALPGCAPESESQRMAGEGAKYGAVGGAVAGAVSALIFGGNPLQGAVAGGIVGASSGAATGAMAGAQADAKKAKPIAADPKLVALRQKIGDTNYAAAMQLAQCQHRGAIATAQDGVAKAQDPQQRMAGLAIQALAAEESGDKAFAGTVYPKIIEQDPSRGSVDKLRADALEAVIRVQAARREHGLPPTCNR
jgi:hypothetical protein